MCITLNPLSSLKVIYNFYFLYFSLFLLFFSSKSLITDSFNLSDTKGKLKCCPHTAIHIHVQFLGDLKFSLSDINLQRCCLFVLLCLVFNTHFHSLFSLHFVFLKVLLFKKILSNVPKSLLTLKSKLTILYMQYVMCFFSKSSIQNITLKFILK